MMRSNKNANIRGNYWYGSTRKEFYGLVCFVGLIGYDH